MLPTRWDPFKELSKDLGSLHRELDDLFRRTFGGRETAAGEPRLLAPVINTFTKGDTFYVQAELPGMRSEDLDVSVEGRALTLRGERKESKQVKEEDYQMRESHYGTFARQIMLPDGVDTDKVHASYEDGILEISMPLTRKIGGRKIAIEGSKKKKELH